MYLSRDKTTRLVLFFSVVAFVSIIGLFLVTTIVFAYFSLTLPNPSKVVRREGFSTIIYDRNNKTLYDVFNKENRIPLDINQMPLTLRQATIAIEDKGFYKHGGYDFLGVIRSFRNALLGRGLAGGSTLTQQLVKNVLLTSERTLTRKIREVILAYQIEQKFSKDQILQMYLNETPYGGSSYGVESAAKNYFAKSAKDLDLVESAILAGLPQQPTNYSPFGKYPTAYIDRTKDVLRRMNEDNYISTQERVNAEKILPKIVFASASAGIKAPHFVFYVKDQLVDKFGDQMVESGGLRVTTTLDWDLQEQTQKIVAEEVGKIKKLKATNGAGVILNPQTGEILSMVGSYDYFDKDFGSYNVATALRQPGSAGKPFIYAAALARGYTPAYVINDVKTDYPSFDEKKPIYTPQNYDGKYRGPMQLRFALGNSINTIAVKLTALVGLKEIMSLGFDSGISTWEPTDQNLKNVGLSLALGGKEVRLMELSSAYGVFATGGLRSDPVSILKVTDNNGKTLYEYRPIPGKRALSPEISFLISHILSDNNARKDLFGETNSLMIPGRTVAVKTGTTDQKRDNWAIGYTPQRVVGVWVGNNDNSVMDPKISSGVTGATPIWNRLVKLSLKDLPVEDFKKPDGVEAFTVDTFGGGLPHGSDPTRSEYFFKGTEPTTLSPIFKRLKISRANGKLANEVELKMGQFDEKDFIVLTETEPISWAGLAVYEKELNRNHWQEAIDKWLSENKKDQAMWNPPKEKSDASQDAVAVNVKEPTDRQRIDSNDLTIKASSFAIREIVKFTVLVDGVEKINKGANSIEEVISVTNGAHELKFIAVDSGGNSGGATIKIGINASWDSPVTTPAPTP